MAGRSDSIRAEICFGGVYGLGASAVLWSSVLFPPPLQVGVLGFIVLAGLMGTARLPIPRIGPVALVPAASLAAMLAYGMGTAVWVAALANVFPLINGRRTDASTSRGVRPGFAVGSDAIAAFLASATFLALGGQVGLASGASSPWAWPQILAIAAHGLTWIAVDFAIHRILVANCTGRSAPWSLRRMLFVGSTRIVLGGFLALTFCEIYRHQSLRVWLLVGPVIYLGYLLSQARREQREHRRRRELQTTALYRSITRALTRAIGARDPEAEAHLERVRDLCLAVGEQFELNRQQLESLATAALLHDIGKLSVPEPILTKPGRLSDAEMDRVRLHPAVGEEILEIIAFPDDVRLIVRHHHERWDGWGYPDGLEQDQIPLGARILSVVDCYDALTSNRPYRRALSDSEARRYLDDESATMFDPDVVEAFLRCLDFRADIPEAIPALAQNAVEPVPQESSLSLPGVQHDLAVLYEIREAVDYALPLDATLTLIAAKLATIVPHKTMVVYRLDEEQQELRAALATGVGQAELSRLVIPNGQRLSGWATTHRRTLVGTSHTNPVDRDGMRSDLEEFTEHPELQYLRSTLVAPLIADQQSIGAVALYDVEGRNFTAQERSNIVQAAGHLAQVLQRTQEIPGQVESRGGYLTDTLTGLPNARFLWLEATQRLDREAATSFGLLAFRVRQVAELGQRWGLEAVDRGLVQIGRRLASCCRSGETLVRFGHDLFLVLTPADTSTELVQRWSQFLESADRYPLEVRSETLLPLRLTAAHASFPEDGHDLDALLAQLESRLSLALDQGRTVVPFRAPRSA